MQSRSDSIAFLFGQDDECGVHAATAAARHSAGRGCRRAGGSIVPWAVAGPDPTRITKFQFGMPLTPQFRFEQDDESCTIFVSLTSAAAATRNTRVFCTDACLQVTCPPYFLQVDLFDDVDSQMCNTKITPGLATIKLFKRVSKLWDQLTSTGNSEEIKSRRERAKRERELFEAKALDDLKEKKRQDDDYVFHKQWDLEKDEKRTVERQAALHKRSAEEDLEKWVAQTEGNDSGNAISSEPVITYFDRQIVEESTGTSSANDAEAADPDAIPLPAAYNAKTARSSVLQHASKKDPIRAFDIREPKTKPSQDAGPSPPQAPPSRPDADASATATAIISAEEDGEGDADGAKAKVAEESRDESGKEGEEEASPRAAAAAGQTPGPAPPEPAAEAPAQPPGRRGASLNRWEAEKIARGQLEAARTVAARGFHDIAERFLERARDAAPWLHEELALQPAEIPALPSRPGDPPPRAPARVEVAFSQGRRSLPARERLETDEEAAEREAEDRRAKEREGRPTSGPVDEQVGLPSGGGKGDAGEQGRRA